MSLATPVIVLYKYQNMLGQVKKIVVSRPECFQKGSRRFLLFSIFIIFTISYLLVNYGSLGKINSIYACRTITIHAYASYGHDC